MRTCQKVLFSKCGFDVVNVVQSPGKKKGFIYSVVSGMFARDAYALGRTEVEVEVFKSFLYYLKCSCDYKFGGRVMLQVWLTRKCISNTVTG